MANTLHCLSTLHLLPQTHYPKTLNSFKPFSKPSQSCKIPEMPSNPMNTTTHLQLLKSVSLPLGLVALPFLLDPQDALAAGGQFGILEGRSFALIHPIVMGGLFAYTLYAGYLGWQWRRVRTIQTEINQLKKQVKPTPVSPDGSTVEPSSPPTEIEIQIQRLSEERKELVKGSYRDKHFDAGSVLLGFGVLEAVFGGVNTYLRTGKLFPGPHLYAGAGITVLWALAAALVPAMQKGVDPRLKPIQTISLGSVRPHASFIRESFLWAKTQCPRYVRKRQGSFHLRDRTWMVLATTISSFTSWTTSSGLQWLFYFRLRR